MRCFDSDGKSLLTRRSRSVSENVDPSAANDPKRLMEVIQSLCKRVADLESKQEPEYIDFVVDFNSTLVNHYVMLNHGFTTPIRWYVVYRDFNASVFIGPNTTDKTLEVYASPVTVGKAVIRVEQSKFSR